ncbi:hypothetical protein M0R72_02375 [Candidatus Pacearchaeota archaeon]|jgi:hypothetical protein|nr:hypothetical protein [Candidatus Pacearchaeota archaeon]
MSANIPGGSSVVPGTYSETRTIQRGVSVPVGNRLAVLIGEGLKEEVLVGSANGKGNDGFDLTYTTTNGSDGRHFLLGKGQSAVAPVVVNRTRLFKNGIELKVFEHPVAIGDTFFGYDAEVDPSTGQILLLGASLVDQGGRQYLPSASNSGTGTISGLALVDDNAPPETWTIRCSSIRRDSGGLPVDGYAKFIARGSVSGTILDGYGNQITWQSNGQVVSNGVLSFSISEGGSPFIEGDNFIVKVQSGTLVSGDSLSARYISWLDLNIPEFFSDLNAVISKHGQPSATNRISLGAQLTWANSTPGVYTIQAKPSIPRRVSYSLVTSSDGHNDIDDVTFHLPLGVTPDVDSNINFFVTDPVTKVETQIIPNKVPFYLEDPATFLDTHVYSYTVVEDDSVQKSGTDGVLVDDGYLVDGYYAELASATVAFGLEDVTATRSVVIFDSLNGNDGTYAVISIVNGKLRFKRDTSFVDETSVQFEVTDSAFSSAQILWTRDMALSLGKSLRCTLVDAKDADFFDAGWTEAYEAAETINIDMVVPLPSQTISAIFQNGKVHVETQSDIRNKHERLLFVGAIQGLTPDNVIGNKPAAVENIGVLEGIQGDDPTEILAGNIEDLTNYGVQDAFGDSYRVVYFYPDQIVVQAGSSNILVDGFFIAAAAAGYLSGSTQIQEPLTNKRLSGFSILRNKLFSPLVIENIVASGISLLTPVQGGGNVIWGKTTVSSLEPTEEEISIVFIRDRISKAMRQAYAPYIGRAESPTFKATLFAVAQALMQTFIQQRLITTYGGLTVNRDSVEPRQWNITVAVQPVYPTNWIYILVNVGRLD